MRTIEAKSLIQSNDNFNIYRGCTYGCIYCDARSTCYQVGDFETIAVKKNAIKMMENELKKRRKKSILTTGGMSDPYGALEKDLKVMRNALKLIAKYGFGISVLTKSTMILRDMDLYEDISRNHKSIIQLTVTTTDADTARKIEPGASPPKERFEALKSFHDKGMITGIWMTPILPFITDQHENIQSIVEMAAEANVTFIKHFGIGTTMREGSREHFYQQLDKHFPSVKEKYQATYGTQYICDAPQAESLNKLFEDTCDKYGILYKHEDIAKLYEKDEQLTLF